MNVMATKSDNHFASYWGMLFTKGVEVEGRCILTVISQPKFTLSGKRGVVNHT